MPFSTVALVASAIFSLTTRVLYLFNPVTIAFQPFYQAFYTQIPGISRLLSSLINQIRYLVRSFPTTIIKQTQTRKVFQAILTSFKTFPRPQVSTAIRFLTIGSVVVRTSLSGTFLTITIYAQFLPSIVKRETIQVALVSQSLVLVALLSMLILREYVALYTLILDN